MIDDRGPPPPGKLWASSVAYVDAMLGDKVDPEARRRMLAQTIGAPKDRPTPRTRADWSQAAIDAQPAKRAQRRYRMKIDEAKERAAAPMRPKHQREPKPVDPAEPTLI